MIPPNMVLILYLAIFVVILFLADALIEFFLSRSFVGPRYRLFIAPGIVIHELSHAAAVIFTGGHVKKINITSPTGGYVIHALKPGAGRHLKQFIISFAPPVGIAVVFIVITALLQPSWFHNINQPLSFHSLTIVSQTSFSRWQTWVHLYLTLSLSAAIAPSWQDTKLAAPGVLTVFALLILFSFTPLQPYVNLVIHPFINPAIIIVAFLTIITAISLALYLFTNLTSSVAKNPFRR